MVLARQAHHFSSFYCKIHVVNILLRQVRGFFQFLPRSCLEGRFPAEIPLLRFTPFSWLVATLDGPCLVFYKCKFFVLRLVVL